MTTKSPPERYSSQSGILSAWVGFVREAWIRRRVTYTNFLVSLAIVAFFFNVLPHVYKASAPALKLSADIPEIIRFFGNSDQGTYLRAAVSFQKVGFSTWSLPEFYPFSPGFSLLESAIISHMPSLPIGWVLKAIESLAWLAFVVLFISAPSEPGGRRAAAGCVIFVFSQPWFLSFYPSSAVLLSEGIATPLFLIAAMLLLAEMRSEKIRIHRLLAIAAIVVISTIFRVQHKIIILAATSLTVVCYCFLFAVVDERRKQAARVAIVITLYLSGLFAFQRLAFDGREVSVWTGGSIHQYMWESDDELGAASRWFAVGGGNLVTKLNPAQYEKFRKAREDKLYPTWVDYSDATIATIVNNASSFVIRKLGILWQFWSGNFSDSLVIPAAGKFGFYCAVIIMALPLGVVATQAFRRNMGAYFTGAFFGGILLGSIAFSMVVHFEERYLHPAKLCFALSPIVLLWREKRPPSCMVKSTTA